MKSMNDATSEINPQALLDEFGEILGFVQTTFQQGRTAHEVETGLWERMLKLGRSLFGAWLELFGDGDAGDRLVLEDGREVRRLEALHRREIQNVFGPFELIRAVYGTREGQKIEAVPLDQRLGLPQCKNSYLLQDWDQHLAAEMPYATVSAALTRILGFTQSVHTLERNQREAGHGGRGVLGSTADPAQREGGGAVGVHGRRQGGADARRRQGTQGDRAPINRRHASRNQEDGLDRGRLYGEPVRAHTR